MSGLAPGSPLNQKTASRIGKICVPIIIAAGIVIFLVNRLPSLGSDSSRKSSDSNPSHSLPAPNHEPPATPTYQTERAPATEMGKSGQEEPSPQSAIDQKDERILQLVYSGPIADFLITDGDIPKNKAIFTTSGCFKVELHSKYKGNARANMIKDLRRQMNTGEVVTSSENGDLAMLGDVITMASFDTRKKTVTFSGKQSYVDINNAIIGTRQVQETFDLDSPKYSTIGKVKSSIESQLQASEGGAKAQRDIPRAKITAIEVIQELRNRDFIRQNKRAQSPKRCPLRHLSAWPSSMIRRSLRLPTSMVSKSYRRFKANGGLCTTRE